MSYVPTKRYMTLQAAEEQWVKDARANPYYFIWYMLDRKPAMHHKVWLANIFHPERLRINIISSREFAKTTIMLYAMLWYMSTYPDRTFGILSVSSVIAEDRIRLLRQVIEHNPRFKNVFPEIRIDSRRRDTQSEFTIWSTAYGSYQAWRMHCIQTASQLDKNPSLFSGGLTGKGVIGRRFSGWLLLDDIVDKSYLSEKAQDDVMTYITMTLEPMITRDAKMINIGTRWTLNDIYERFKHNQFYTTIETPAIWYDQNGKPYPTWPDFWPMEALVRKRETMNNDVLFKIMYLCDPTAINANLFRPEHLYRDIPNPMPPIRSLYISGDFAASMKTAADWNVLWAIASDGDNNHYILDGKRYKAELEDNVDHVANFADDMVKYYGRLDGVLIEAVGFQSWMEQLLRSQRPDLPAYPVTPKGDKMFRARVVAGFAQREKLHIRQAIEQIDPDLYNAMTYEWLNFSDKDAIHDDTLDAAGLYFQHIGSTVISSRVTYIEIPNDMYAPQQNNNIAYLQRPVPKPPFAPGESLMDIFGSPYPRG